MGIDMTEEPAKPKTPKKKKWVVLTESEIKIIIHRQECRLSAKVRYADKDRLLIFDTQNMLKEKNT